eukprot:CAMPEP_0203985672 /NCGR_PEP_ID=MMETSP0360-20130528/5492_1 /ASSEMBLY_ACC=CAM_ASM_000342 /TAXON_ID=268821 /ORGANISM="Scrippsiella Hangoei, Strain SHTV-5" /LENGTH=90 /DNA_ID=CAMNT_0050924977 /DNA_START=22 /DNA_END=291 /DNA_ORIENTATION=+
MTIKAFFWTLGHLALILSQRVLTMASHKGVFAKCSLMSLQTSSVASFSISSTEATWHTSFSISSGVGIATISAFFCTLGHMALILSQSSL